MKKKLIITTSLLAALTLTACNNGKDDPVDPIIDYPYSYYEPYMVWGADRDEVTKYMSDTFRNWYVDESVFPELMFLDGKYKTIGMSYKFEDSKLASTTLSYPLRSDSFDKLKSDIESRYKVEFTYMSEYGLWHGHSVMKNMDVDLYNLDSSEMLHTIMAIFTGTGPSPSDDIKFEITPSNKSALNYTDFTTISITFPEAKKVSWYDSFGMKYFSLIDAEGNPIWMKLAQRADTSLEGNVITIQLSYSSYETLTEEGDYTFVIDPETILVDGRLLPEQRIKYHITAIPPVITSFELKFDDKVTNENELHFYIEDGLEIVGWEFFGGTPIYDDDDNNVGKVYDFKQVAPNHFLFVLRMETADTTKQYHFDVAEGLLTARTKAADIPSAATKVRFSL